MQDTRWQSGEDVAKEAAAAPEDPRLFLIRRRAATGTYDEATASDVAYLLNRLDMQEREINNLNYAADINFRKWREAEQKLEKAQRE